MGNFLTHWSNLAKAGDDEPPKPGPQDDGSIITDTGAVISAAEVESILGAIKAEDLVFLTGVITPEIEKAFADAGYTQLAQLQLGTARERDILDVLDREAADYAEARAGDLITQITETTRDRVRGTITDALTEGWAKPELSDELQANFAFSETRADMIAHTELAMAHSYGRVPVMREAGATKKRWLLSADHDPKEDCYCSEAADAGWVDIDDNFVDDDDYDFPPGHPNCWCDWVGNLGGEDEEDSDDDGDSGSSRSDVDGSADSIDSSGDSDAQAADDADKVTKEFNPDQPRDERGRWSSGGGGASSGAGAALVTYHGTRAQVLDAIKSEGLKTTAPHNFVPGLYEGARGQSVYVSTDIESAKSWAYMVTRGTSNTAPVILRVSVPERERSALVSDKEGMSGDRQFTGEIPPHWITGVSVWNTKTDEWGAFEALKRIPTFYAVLVVQDSVEKREVDSAAHEAAPSPRNDRAPPSRAQAKAGNYKMGHLSIGGLDFTVENPAGSRRRPEWPVLPAHYGYVKRTEGADGDHLDVFIRPGTDSDYNGPVYVIDQFRLDGTFDEHKCLVGWSSQAVAIKSYLKAYQAGWRVGPVTRLTWQQFAAWTRSADTQQPISQTVIALGK